MHLLVSEVIRPALHQVHQPAQAALGHEVLLPLVAPVLDALREVLAALALYQGVQHPLVCPARLGHCQPDCIPRLHGAHLPKHDPPVTRPKRFPMLKTDSTSDLALSKSAWHGQIA